MLSAVKDIIRVRSLFGLSSSLYCSAVGIGGIYLNGTVEHQQGRMTEPFNPLLMILIAILS